ncbi:MAG TPA: polysaccharide deacetylase family protein, partial [Gemmatimonadales bacterium]|nr:polysaccharide deacetylase family protein [Gemmatimonadales bacterium]
MRAVLKSTAEAVLLHGGAAALGRRRVRGGRLVLAYHNIVADALPPGGDRSLHLAHGEFVAQLDVLECECEVVPLPALLGEAPAGHGTRPRVAITFDDAYHGAAALGVAELRRRGLPATIFVTPGMLGGRSFWWDALADAGGAGLGDDARAHVLDALAGDDAAARRWARETGRPVVEPGPERRTATEAELLAALAHPGLALGAHTWSHPNLARLQGAALAHELAAPLAWLRERTDRAIPWLAYPYGLTSPAVAVAARAAGYAGGCLVSGGWLSAATPHDPFAIPRFNVPAGISRAGFALRLAGLLA